MPVRRLSCRNVKGAGSTPADRDFDASVVMRCWLREDGNKSVKPSVFRIVIGVVRAVWRDKHTCDQGKAAGPGPNPGAG